MGGGCLSLAKCLTAKSQRNDWETETLIPTSQGGFFDDAIAFNHNAQSAQLPSASRDTSVNDGLTCSQGAAVAIGIAGSELGHALRANPSASGDKGDGGMNTTVVATRMSVRRLTPVECERLQGFPCNWTLIPGKFKKRKPADWTETINNLMSLGMDRSTAINLANGPDGPRYKAIGNSMAVPCMGWIGRRIQAASKPMEVEF